jgi:hypothetical protein
MSFTVPSQSKAFLSQTRHTRLLNSSSLYRYGYTPTIHQPSNEAGWGERDGAAVRWNKINSLFSSVCLPSTRFPMFNLLCVLAASFCPVNFVGSKQGPTSETPTLDCIVFAGLSNLNERLCCKNSRGIEGCEVTYPIALRQPIHVGWKSSSVMQV